MRTIEAYNGKTYSIQKTLGYHDGHFWRAHNGSAGVHAMNIALGAAYGCNDANRGPMSGHEITRAKTGEGIYEGTDMLLYAVSVLEAYMVEEII